ncbi:MAG: septum formation initiator family protein [Acidimicrobiales bacterium]|jgi:cell division protein FtsB
MIARARIFLLVSFVAGIAIVATEFPLGQLLRQHAAVAQATSQLTELQAENRSLASEVSSLHQPSTVARIAHQDYGLVAKGQRSVVVLPSPSKSGSSAGPLGSISVPKSDLVPTDSIVSSTPAAASAPAKGEGFWARLLQRFEFWKATP